MYKTVEIIMVRWSVNLYSLKWVWLSCTY